MANRTVEPFAWQRWLNISAVSRLIEISPQYEYLTNLITNKHDAGDTDALIDAVMKMFDLCDSISMQEYVTLRHRIEMYLNIASFVCSISFIVARSSNNQWLWAIGACGFMSCSVWLRVRTPSVIRHIEQCYHLRKAHMLKTYLEQLGYTVDITQD